MKKKKATKKGTIDEESITGQERCQGQTSQDEGDFGYIAKAMDVDARLAASYRNGLMTSATFVGLPRVVMSFVTVWASIAFSS